MKHIECRDCDELIDLHRNGMTHCDCHEVWPCPKLRIVASDDLVPEAWVAGNRETSVEEWGQREYDAGHKSGLEDGVEKAAKFVDKCAAEAFADEDDETAQALRSLAKRIRHL